MIEDYEAYPVAYQSDFEGFPEVATPEDTGGNLSDLIGDIPVDDRTDINTDIESGTPEDPYYGMASKEELDAINAAIKASGGGIGLTDLPASLWKSIKGMFTDAKGNTNYPLMAAAAGGLYGMLGGNKPQTGGYKGTIPKYTAVRQQVEQPAYVPYSGQPVMGRRSFTDTQFVAKGDTPALEAAQQAASTQAGILAGYQPKTTAPEVKAAQAAQPFLSPDEMIARERNIVANPTQVTMAKGGIAGTPRYLRGATDGMADKIPSSIDDKQPAKLSHGEFVIPADVVSHLGNGNSDAGANALYKMMDKVRKARTGTTKQGKRINPEKFTPGGIAGYAGGGAVAFQTGGTTSSAIAPTSQNPYGGTTETGLASWAGDYVTDYLGRGKALAETPYQAYQGPLTAGVSPLQQQAFQKASNLGGAFDSTAAQQYMNPYIQNALQPQLQELRRQADISQQGLSGKFAQAGALGGARDTLARSEGIRNLLTAQSGLIGGAYKDAYDKAMQQYNISRQQELADLGAMAGAGATQRGIEQEGITAQKGAFEQEREDPFSKIKFEQSLLSGLPTASTTTTPNLSALQQLGITGGQMSSLYDLLNKWLNPEAAAKTASAGTTKTPV